MDGYSETSIRRLWEQLTPSSLLHTTDNRPLVVLSPGVPNCDAGPDYSNALIRIGGRLYRGDVEVHRDERDWNLHRHHTDVHYNRVVLHVVGSSNGPESSARTRGKRSIPTLVLRPAPIDAQSAAVNARHSSDECRCHAMAFAASARRLRQVLHRLGRERIERRVRTFEARLNELLREEHWRVREGEAWYGTSFPGGTFWSTHELSATAAWDQLLYEGLMEGMGYAKNKRPFSALAQHVPLHMLRPRADQEPDRLMALLFGAAGLLPSTRGMKERACREYVLRLRKMWNEMRALFRSPLLHEGDWLFFRLRPANFPTARLAAMGHLLPLLLRNNGLQRILGIFRTAGVAPRKRRERLQQLLAFVPDPFWSAHLHFRGSGPGPSIALGPDRIDAIIFNTFVPAALLYARLLGDRAMRMHARALARALPAPPRNSVIRFVDRNVLRGEAVIDSAVTHHGGIELYRTFCERRRCGECPICRPS